MNSRRRILVPLGTKPSAMLNHTSLRLAGDVEMAHSRRGSLIKADAGGQTQTSGPRIFADLRTAYILCLALPPQRRTSERAVVASAKCLPAQPVDATQALNLSAGVSNCKVSRGRSFS